jgi:hypothetical protein
MLTLDKWIDESSGTLTRLRVKAGDGSNIKVVLYADNGGEPGDLLNAHDTGTTVIAGIWNTVRIPSTPVVVGTAYWLGFISEGICMGYVAGSGTMRYKTNVSYCGYVIPNLAGTGFISLTGYYHQAAGWGTPPPIPLATAFITPVTVVTFKWGAVDSEYKYHLQLNTSSEFSGTDLFNREVGHVTLQEVIDPSLGTTYYWRVKAGNDAGWGSWSSTRGFTVN